MERGISRPAKETIEGLLDAAIEVITVNGTFQVAQTVVFLGGRDCYRLRVENTHPLMRSFVKEGGHFAVELFCQQGSRLIRVALPDQLLPKVAQMRVAATLSDDAARAARSAMLVNSANTMAELGIAHVPVVISAEIGPMPRPMPQGMLDPMPVVRAKFSDGQTRDLFTFYPDELQFSAQEFIGLTAAQAIQLRADKDRTYLTSDESPARRPGERCG